MARAARPGFLMRFLYTAFMAVSSLWGPALSAAVPAQPATVQDLPYGEALFYFYQDDYFSAITHVLAARDRQQLPHHDEEAELLLGGMYVSYGMHAQAQALFERVLDRTATPQVRDRAWFYLAKIAYARGNLERARAALAHIDGPLAKPLQGEDRLLRAQVFMADGDYAQAANALRDWKGRRDLAPYARFNLGIALIRSGEPAQGADLLDAVGTMKARDEESDSLRDKANLALGYSLLQRNDPRRARQVLERVRLNGPFSAKALLGFGWADAAMKQYEQALVPWTELQKRDTFDAAVQESLLAVPYALGQLQAYAAAAQRYQAAIAAYEAEAAQVTTAMEAVRDGGLLKTLLDARPQEQMGWSWRLRKLPDTAQTRYLMQLLAGHEFQEALKNYRDLVFLQHHLERQAGDMDAYDDMLATRRTTYARVLPRAQEVLRSTPDTGLTSRRDALATRLADVRRTQDPLALATTAEGHTLAQLDTIAARLARLPQEPQVQALRDQQRRLRGVLVWRIHADFEARLWDAQKDLRQLDAALTNVRAGVGALARAGQAMPKSFEGYDERIRSLRDRVQGLLPRVQAARTAQGGFLQNLALEELERQRARLDQYRVQARLALAQVYDRAATTPETTP